jgi:uncharacterized protein VirK/YbjX
MKSFLDSLTLLRRSKASSSPWETAKFALRGGCHFAAHCAWSRFLLGNAERLHWAEAHPQLLWKLQRPYLQIDVPVATKLAWLRDHYEWMEGHWPVALRQALHQDGQAVLAHIQAGENAAYRLTLGVDPQFAKEGELTLALWRDGERLAVLAFTLHRDADGLWVVHIGCLQGAVGADSADVIRTATKELQGLRPKQAVLQALYALASQQGISALRAVANAGHIYQGRRRRRERVLADYDAFWSEFGAVRHGTTFHLPAVLERKALADVPSRKRAQYKRRYELEDDLLRQIEAALAGQAA